MSAWGNRALLIDTSAWARSDRIEVEDEWQRALFEDRLRLSPLIRLEILYSARSPGSFDLLDKFLAAIRPVPVSPAIVAAARGAMWQLSRRSAGSHRIPVVDYVVAATAQEIGADVLHYDADYDRLAEVLAFESRWLAAAGALA